MKTIQQILLVLGIFLTSISLACLLYIPLVFASSSQANVISCTRDGTNHNDFSELGTDPYNNQSANSIPVVFVHGWTGGPMEKTAALLKKQLGSNINPFLFDYHQWSLFWASDPNIAPCLADYINKVYQVYQSKGGQGHIIVIAHSMGGLALRYASDEKLVQNPIKNGVISNVITLDTPYLGSPWGGSNWAYLLSWFNHFFGEKLSKNNSPLNAGDCLIQHQGAQSLSTKDCDGDPPYLPQGIQLSEFAGNITIHRSLFGVTLYTIPLNSDGIVTVPSSQGYVTSGPNDQATPGQVIIQSYTEDCSIDTGTVIQEALKLRSLDTLSADVINSLILFDYPTLQDLQNDNLSTLPVRTYSLAAAMAGSCSHTNIYSNPDVINHMASIIQGVLTKTSPQVRLAYGTNNGLYVQLGSGVPKQIQNNNGDFNPDSAQSVWSNDGRYVVFVLEGLKDYTQNEFVIYDTSTGNTHSVQVNNVDSPYPSGIIPFSSSSGFAFEKMFPSGGEIDSISPEGSINKLFDLPKGGWSLLTVQPNYAIIAGQGSDSSSEEILRVDNSGTSTLDADVSDPQIAPAMVDQGVITKDGSLAYTIVTGAGSGHSSILNLRKISNWSNEPSITLPGANCDGLLGIQSLSDGSLVEFLSQAVDTECNEYSSTSEIHSNQIQVWLYKNNQGKMIGTLNPPSGQVAGLSLFYGISNQNNSLQVSESHTNNNSSQSNSGQHENQGSSLCPFPTPGGNQISTSVYWILCGVNSM